jgi:hypothetical protein
MPVTELCPHGSHEPKVKESITVAETQQTNDGSDEQLLSPSGHDVHPAAFVINSLKSRAAARAMLERRPKPEFEFGLGDSPRPRLV